MDKDRKKEQQYHKLIKEAEEKGQHDRAAQLKIELGVFVRSVQRRST